jgi:hypothetical protein
MWYLANPSTERVREAMRQGLLGFMDTPLQGQRVPAGVTWAADNGCYGKGYPGDDRWFEWLTNHPADRSRCLFATAPDVVADAEATATRSTPWLNRIRDLGYPVAYVAQNGVEDWPPPWDRIDVLFLGGDDEFKLGPAGARVAREAKTRGLWLHVGRVNSRQRVRYALQELAADSIDGTYIKRGPDINLPKAVGWVREARNQTWIGEAS